MRTYHAIEASVLAEGYADNIERFSRYARALENHPGLYRQNKRSLRVVVRLLDEAVERLRGIQEFLEADDE